MSSADLGEGNLEGVLAGRCRLPVQEDGERLFHARFNLRHVELVCLGQRWDQPIWRSHGQFRERSDPCIILIRSGDGPKFQPSPPISFRVCPTMSLSLCVDDVGVIFR